MDSEPQWPNPDSRGVCRRKDERCKEHFPWHYLLPSVSAFTLPGGDWQKLESRRFKRTEAPVITGADPGLSPLAGIISYISRCLLCLPQPQASGGSNTIYPYMRRFNQKVTHNTCTAAGAVGQGYRICPPRPRPWVQYSTSKNQTNENHNTGTPGSRRTTKDPLTSQHMVERHFSFYQVPKHSPCPCSTC